MRCRMEKANEEVRVDPYGKTRGLFCPEPACSVQAARRRSVWRAGSPKPAARGAGSFPRSDRTDRLAAMGQPGPEQACPNEVR
jgi:hypothetical protein